MDQHKTQPPPQHPEVQEEPAVKVEVVHRSDGLIDVYSNYFSTTYTLHDARIVFGQLYRVPQTKFSEQPKNIIEERVAITMAWSELKVITQALVKTVLDFEAKNGEIKHPELP